MKTWFHVDILNGRDNRIRTRTNGVGDRCATIDTMSLYDMHYEYNIAFYFVQAYFFYSHF